MDYLKPKYHFMPARNWMNDPVGLYHDGTWYHMFYQYNPFGDSWGSIHWGHCRSTDLLHWEERPIALTPDRDNGEEHCFSGSLVVPERGEPCIFYTRIPFGDNAVSHRAEQWQAPGDRDLEYWPPERRIPVLRKEDHGNIGELIDWRDPFVFRAFDRWYMLLGGSLDGEGVILLYRSDNLTDWTYRRILLTDSEESPFLECPNLILTGGKAILLYSPANKPVRCLTGCFTEEETFQIEHKSILDNSAMEGLYAPQMARDREGFIYMIAWAPEESRKGTGFIKGYSGAQTLPRHLSLSHEGYVRMEPHSRCLELRRSKYAFSRSAPDGTPLALPSRGWQWELTITLKMKDGDQNNEPPLRLRICEDHRTGELTELRFERRENRLVLDRSRSTLLENVSKTALFIPLEETTDTLSMRIFQDGSLIEIFLNARYALTSRLYPSSPEAVNTTLFCYGMELEGQLFTCGL
ncbi:MAG: glycoside hydrolase family 32 protein [Spirochaetales bacterium]|nr:glycoside hydrolase family 32 protein [Spirochaetales bacterium]